MTGSDVMTSTDTDAGTRHVSRVIARPWVALRGRRGPLRAGNDLGVVDHTVRLPDGIEVLNPMRVLPHADGAEVLREG